MKVAAGALAAFAALAFGNPALANSAAASADVTAPLRAAQGAKPAQTGDEEFRSLYAGWTDPAAANSVMPSLVTPATGSLAAVPTSATMRPTTVSIPSRMPVEGAALTSGYGMRTHPILGGRRQHKGIDLAQPVGTPVYATADGYISRADWFSSYGLFISIEHGAQIETRYGHLSRLNVAAGQYVHKGDVIGYVGTTGRSTGPHLHYEVRIAGTAVNPIPYLQGLGTAKLPAGEAASAMGDGEDE
ncbi:M23 family metallopeptidase [Novosphingobium sp.]|uniref:M23 family metallopeptidase n=1 Tax=Novosphingobium sp. TaxID=1874826 RepID=UPI0035AF442F